MNCMFRSCDTSHVISSSFHNCYLQRIFYIIWYRNLCVWNFYILWFPTVWSNFYFQNHDKMSCLFYISAIQPYTIKIFIRAKASDVTKVCDVWMQESFSVLPLSHSKKWGPGVTFLKMLYAISRILTMYRVKLSKPWKIQDIQDIFAKLHDFIG